MKMKFLKEFLSTFDGKALVFGLVFLAIYFIVWAIAGYPDIPETYHDVDYVDRIPSGG